MSGQLHKWKREIHERDDYTCYYCENKFAYNELHVDHLVPASKGGKDKKENLVTACKKCNLTKSDLTLKDFLLKTIKKHKELTLQVKYLQRIIWSISDEVK